MFELKTFLILFFVLCLSTSCIDAPPATNNSIQTEANDDLTIETLSDENTISIQTSDLDDNVQTMDVVRDLPEKHNCELSGTILENNQKWLRASGILLTISADEQTYDEDMGDSHRMLTIYDTETCKEIFKKELPVNVSEDYPYYLMPVDEREPRLVGIQGFENFFIFDTKTKQLSAPLRPNFSGSEQLEDAQSGTIQSMMTFGQYMIGSIEGQGAFAYDMTIPKTPKQEKAFASYQQEDGTESSLFLLDSEAGEQYAILPNYDIANRKFELNTLLDTPITISDQVTKSALNNRFLILRTKPDNTAIAVDMKTRQRIELSDDLAQKSTQEILSWVKGSITE